MNRVLYVKYYVVEMEGVFCKRLLFIPMYGTTVFGIGSDVFEADIAKLGQRMISWFYGRYHPPFHIDIKNVFGFCDSDIFVSDVFDDTTSAGLAFKS